jgi:hypothetical protein
MEMVQFGAELDPQITRTDSSLERQIYIEELNI